MKKLLPKSVNNPQGFTLIELLVVVAIIAILSVIGVAVFGGVQGRARDAKRKADVDSISKAYEATYDIENGVNTPYRVLTATDFQGGTIPQTPEKTNYTGLLAADGPNYTVCAALEGGVAGCSAPSATCYCKSAAQATTAATGINQPCGTATLTALTGGASCKVTNTITSSTIYVCPAAAATINCNTNGPASVSVPAYTAQTGGTNLGNVTIYRTNSPFPAGVILKPITVTQKTLVE